MMGMLEAKQFLEYFEACVAAGFEVRLQKHEDTYRLTLYASAITATGRPTPEVAAIRMGTNLALAMQLAAGDVDANHPLSAKAKPGEGV